MRRPPSTARRAGSGSAPSRSRSCAPVLLFVVVLNVIGAFQVFGQVYMITRGGPELSTRTLVQYIYETAFQNYRMGYAASLSWLLFLVIAGFSVVQFRMMRER